jgi:predicted ATPase/transcriptional regulator with XRE-family HTH domain
VHRIGESPSTSGHADGVMGSVPTTEGDLGVISSQLRRLRLQRGFTQEELSERSGISVRTIRNLERGQILAPRRASVEMLLEALDTDLRRDTPVDPSNRLDPALGLALGWNQLGEPGGVAWHGTRQQRTALIGRDTAVDQVSQRVDAHRLVVVTGPGGVGKSRIALAAAERSGDGFPDGVFVAELGRIPPEHRQGVESTTELAGRVVDELLASGPEPSGPHRLLVLDHAEHLPESTTRLAERLLDEHPELHILVTARRPPRLHGACIWEVAPLADEPAAELLLERARASCPTLDLSDQLSRVVQLCRKLDGLPRLIEFAARRLRMVSLSTLAASEQAVMLLGGEDYAGLAHQRTPAASLRWSLDLLGERHHALLRHLVRLPDLADLGLDGVGPAEYEPMETVELLVDLVESSLLLVDRGDQYRYRMPWHVRAFLTAGEVPGPAAGASAIRHPAPTA